MKSILLNTGKFALGGALAFIGLTFIERPLPSSANSGNYILVATIGYQSGQPGFFMPKNGSASTDTMLISFESKAHCELVEAELKGNYREDIFNSTCISLPSGAKVIR